jgi:hypothetical protein
MSDLADISIRLTANGMGSFVVNGEDVSNSIVGITLQTRVGQPLVVQVSQLAGSVEIAGQGVVQVVNPGDGRAAVQDFLERVDASTLDEEVLNTGSMDESPMVAVLRILKEKAARNDR